MIIGGAILAPLVLFVGYMRVVDGVGLREGINPAYWYRRFNGLDLFDPNTHFLLRGNRDLKEVALTIDDGPHEPNCSAILDLLKERGIKATFFVVGKRVKEQPEVVKRMLAEGHELGNHSNSHKKLVPLPDHNIVNEVDDCAINVERATGQKMRLFRPPGLGFDERVIQAARKHDYVLVDWTCGSQDYRDIPEEAIFERVVGHTNNGSIILLHDERVETVRALPKILDTLVQQGYKFVTVSEMISHLPDKARPADWRG
jgi:peptidoglycan/xylan/chitin deacetylase (PgdA/CDA1 family)